MAESDTAVTSGRLAHKPQTFFAGDLAREPAEHQTTTAWTPAVALAAEGPRRADLVAWAGANRARLGRMRLLAPAAIGALLAEHAGLESESLKVGTLGTAAAAGLVAAADRIDAMIAFTDPIGLRAGDTTTRSLTRLAVLRDIPLAGNRATADLLLTTFTPANTLSTTDLDANALPVAPALPIAPTTHNGEDEPDPVRGPLKLWTVRATVDDVPGSLAILAASLARLGINILAVQVHLTPDGPVDEFLVASPPVLPAAYLASAVIDGGARAPRVASADAHALVDAPTRALSLAARLIHSPEDLPGVLTSLLPGAELAWRAEPPDDHEDDAGRLWLTDPTGGGFVLARRTVPLTPAEAARAYAMIDVAVGALSRRAVVSPEPQVWHMLLADGTDVTVRRAHADDLGGVVELHARCSPTSRLRRYLAGTRCPSSAVLVRLLSPVAGHCLVAEDRGGQIIALANLMWEDPTPELALLVDDDWQRRRIGTALAGRLAAIAAKRGAHAVKATVHATNTPMIRIMSALGRRTHRQYEGGVLSLVSVLHSHAGHTQRLPSSMCRSQSSYGIEVPTYSG